MNGMAIQNGAVMHIKARVNLLFGLFRLCRGVGVFFVRKTHYTAANQFFLDDEINKASIVTEAGTRACLCYTSCHPARLPLITVASKKYFN